jgi:TetR/AcrR family transcriptional regulator, copper-responsive repressor
MSPVEALSKRPRGRPRSFEREAALEKAMDVFWRHGYEGTSLAELTKAMGINAPSLYAAFQSKEELYMEAIDLYIARRREMMERIYNEEPTARAAVERMLREFVDTLCAKDSPVGCMLAMSAGSCSAASEPMQRALGEKRALGRQLMKARMDKGVRDGEMPRGTNTGALADFYGMVFQGMAMQSGDGATRKSLLAAAETAMRAWPAAAK